MKNYHSDKFLLTVAEASEYTNIGQRRIYALIKNGEFTGVVHVGNKLLVNRKEFEKFLSSHKYL